MTKKRLIGKELLQNNVAQAIVGSLNISFQFIKNFFIKRLFHQPDILHCSGLLIEHTWFDQSFYSV